MAPLSKRNRPTNAADQHRPKPNYTLIRRGRSLAHPWHGDGWAGAIAVLVIAGCLLLPLRYSTTTADAFARPKTLTMWVVVAGLLVVTFGAVAARRPPRLRLGLLDIALLVFVLATLAASLLSIDRRNSLIGERLQFQGLLSLLSYVAAFLLARSVFRTPQRLRQLCGFVVLGGAAVTAIAVLERAGLDPRPFPKIGRVFSTIGQPNALAAYFVVTIPISVALAWSATSAASRRVLVGVSGVSIAGLVWTLSRGGYLGLLVAGLLFVGLYRVRARRWPLLAAAIISAVTVGVLVLTPARNLPDSTQADAPTADLGRRSDHLSLWRVGVAIAVDHPLFGTGPETYPIVFPEYRDEVLDEATAKYLSQFRPESPHNVYIATASGSGFPAMVALVVVLVLAEQHVLGGFKQGSDEAWPILLGIAAAMAGHMVTDLFMTQETTGSWVFWVLAGAAVGTSQHHRRGVSGEDTR